MSRRRLLQDQVIGSILNIEMPGADHIVCAVNGKFVEYIASGPVGHAAGEHLGFPHLIDVAEDRDFLIRERFSRRPIRHRHGDAPVVLGRHFLCAGYDQKSGDIK